MGAGAPAAYALCRPPGHHAGPSAHGGSCYLNNAAIAAQALRDAGFERVAVIDLDAHHANGTQAIFYARGDVFFGSLHVDPGAGWFPALRRACGRARRGRRGREQPEPAAGPRDRRRGLAGGGRRAVHRRGPPCADAVVVSLGVDAAAGDPESPLRGRRDGYREAGERVGSLGPTVVVQEGGYEMETLGELTVAALGGLWASRRRAA